MSTDVHVTELSRTDHPSYDALEARSDFSRRLHAAAGRIPNGAPLGQWVFKLVTSELRGNGVTGAEAVKRGIEAVRETDPDFEPSYDPSLLEQ